MSSILWRRLVVVELLVIASLFGFGPMVAQSAGASTRQTSVIAQVQPTITSGHVSECDNGALGHQGEQFVYYTVTAASAPAGYQLTATVTGFSPGVSAIAPSSITLSLGQSGHFFDVGIPNSYTQASLSLQLDWTGSGLPTIIDNATIQASLTGNCASVGPAPSDQANSPVVSMARTPDGNGYWLVTSAGQILTFGDAGFYGEVNGLLNQPSWGLRELPTARATGSMQPTGGSLLTAMRPSTVPWVVTHSICRWSA